MFSREYRTLNWMTRFFNRFSLSTDTLSTFFALASIWISYILLFRLNLLQMDLAGHLASGVSFARGYFHGFNDQFFAGYTHALFYPPLEDLILCVLNALGTFFSKSPIEVFPLYLIIISGFYIYSMSALTKEFHSRGTRFFMSFCFIYILLMDKDGQFALQGMSFADLWATGLTSQILSSGFFLFFIREIIFLNRFWPLTVFFSLTFLSHIVVGLSASLLLAMSILCMPEWKKYLRVMLFSSWLTACYWLPFVCHRSYMASSSKVWIWSEFYWGLTLLSAAALVYFFRVHTSRALLATSMVLFFTGNILRLLADDAEAWGQWIPNFHYYRLTIVGVFLLAIGIATATYRIKNFRGGKWINFFFIASFFICLVQAAPPLWYNFSWGSLIKRRFNFEKLGDLKFKEYGRYFVIEYNRSIDFGLESLLAVRDPEFKSTKGLYWESSSYNALQSSYLANLFGVQSILNYYQDPNPMSCRVTQCFLNSYFRTFNVRGVIGNANLIDFDGIPGERKECFKSIFSSLGTSSFHFAKKGSIGINRAEFGVYDLIPKIEKNTQFLNTIEKTSLDRILGLDQQSEAGEFWQKAVITEIRKSCEKNPEEIPNLPIFLGLKDLNEMQRLTGSIDLPNSEPTPRFQKVSSNHYNIKLPNSELDQIYILKMKMNCLL